MPLRYTLVQNFSFVYVPVWMLTGIACWRRGYTPARLFLFAWAAYMVGIVVEAAVDAGMVTGLGIVRESSLDVALDYLVYLGIAVESVLLSLSLAEAYRSATNDKIDHLHALIQMSAQTEAMASLAYSDGLTNLPNRVAFMERVDEALLAAKRHGREAALLYVDVNNFKRINDTHGHAAGDAVLIEAAQRLRRGVRGDEMVGRIAGDEFAVFLPSIEGRTDAEQVRERLCGAFDVPCRLRDLELDVRISIGIAYFPQPCATREELFAAADAAMYAVKRA